jgi:DNA-binding response OmpR family regulator
MVSFQICCSRMSSCPTTGAELAAELSGPYPALKVLFTTGYTRDAIVHNGVLDAGKHLLPKPFAIEDLAAKVRILLDEI